MKKAEIKHISEFLKDLEEGLYERDYAGVFANIKTIYEQEIGTE
jgi:hypothetical protein